MKQEENNRFSKEFMNDDGIQVKISFYEETEYETIKKAVIELLSDLDGLFKEYRDGTEPVK